MYTQEISRILYANLTNQQIADIKLMLDGGIAPRLVAEIVTMWLEDKLAARSNN